MNKRNLIIGLVVISILIPVSIYFRNSSDNIVSDIVKIKCPEEYAENEFDVYVDEAAKWIAEAQAKNPDMTEEELFDARQQALIASGCQGRGEQGTQLESSNSNSEPITAEELEEYKKDPTAPDWMKDAESCTRIDGKIFCKLNGE